MSENITPKTSWLNCLWANYGGKSVQSQVSENPSDDVILTEKALFTYLKDDSNSSIVSLQFEPDPTNKAYYRLSGQTRDGSIKTVVKIPIEVHIISFSKGTTENGNKSLVIALSDGSIYNVDLEEFFLKEGETDTITTRISNTGAIQSSIKVDKLKNGNSVIKLKSTQEGIYATLPFSENSYIKFDKDDEGILASIPLENTEETIKFSTLTLDEYLNLETPNSGTIYFITDKPYLYLNNIRYGCIVESKISSTSTNPVSNNAVKAYVDKVINEAATSGGILVDEEMSDTSTHMVQNKVIKSYTDKRLSKKQDTLVSGSSIKTINNQSLLGEGNLTINGGIPMEFLSKEEYENLEDKDDSTLYLIFED